MDQDIENYHFKKNLRNIMAIMKEKKMVGGTL